MTEPVTVDQVAAELGMAPLSATDRAHLGRLLPAARRVIERQTGHVMTGMLATLQGDDLELANQAVVSLVAAWFANPEAVTSDRPPTEVPLGARWIIAMLDRWDDGADA